MALQETMESPLWEDVRPASRPAALGALLRTLDRHDTYTAGHSLRASIRAVAVAGALGCSPDRIEMIRQAALVHDIGKLRVPETVLHKPLELDVEEHHLIRMHPALGADILSRIPGLEEFVPIVLHHHERWDGLGYPGGISGTEIPIESRIIFVADTFDAMTTNRPYGRVSTPAEAIAEIQHGAGKQFDPAVASAASVLATPAPTTA